MAQELKKDHLAQKLIRKISREEYPVGSLLPKEMDLAQTEGVSRQTVRAAMDKLLKMGLIKRTPHVGTQVISRGISHSFDQKLSSLSDLDRLAAHNPRKILDIREVVVSRELSRKIQCLPGETLIRFSMVRLGVGPDALPIAWTSEYVGLEFQELVYEAPKTPDALMIELICSLFHRRCVEVRQTIEATRLTQEAALHLKAKEGEPCLRIFRRYVNQHEKTLLTTVSYHPSDRYAFCLNVKLDSKH